MDQMGAFRETVEIAERLGMSDTDDALGLSHLRDMLKRAEENEYSGSKLGRWLGWAQCALVASGVGFTLEDAKTLNLRHSADVPSNAYLPDHIRAKLAKNILSSAPVKLVVIESPFAGDIEGNLTYARRAMSDSLHRGEAPIASHLLYTQEGILDDDIPAERTLGIESGLAWAKRSDLTAFYTDRGWSRGMIGARERCEAEGRPWVERRIGDNP